METYVDVHACEILLEILNYLVGFSETPCSTCSVPLLIAVLYVWWKETYTVEPDILYRHHDGLPSQETMTFYLKERSVSPEI